MTDKIDTTLEKVMGLFRPKIETLLNIWLELGHTEEVIEQRCDLVITHTESLLHDMLAEADSEKKSILDKIEKSLKKIYVLRQRLRIVGPMDGYEHTPFVLLVDELQHKIKQLENDIQTRLGHIKELFGEEHKLCQRLGLVPKRLETKPLPSKEELHAFETYIEKMRLDVFGREEKLFEIKEDIVRNLNDLGITPLLDFERNFVSLSEEEFILTNENMKKLEEWQNSLKKEVEERKEQINELREKLLSLWELLNETADYRATFSSEVNGIDESVVRKLQEEIYRCEQLKKAHIKEFIVKSRSDIEEWWDRCLYGPQQKSSFMALFKSEGYTDDLLMLHEMQVNKLKTYHANNKQIFDLIKKRDELWQRTIYLTEKTTCKDRFKNRGGELLKEEKERKEINIQLPQVEQKLLTELRAYKSQTGTDFLVHDEILENAIQEDFVKFKTVQTEKLSARKKARSDLTVTPGFAGKSLLRTTSTTNLTSTKRKAVPATNTGRLKSSSPSKRLRVEPSTGPRTVPKARVNQQSGKVSYCVRRRLCPTKRLSKDSSLHDKSRKPSPRSEEYNKFKGGVKSRSSLAGKQKENEPKTPQRTPYRSPRTPRGNPRLKAATPLTIIF